jgi:hypothetical protein
MHAHTLSFSYFMNKNLKTLLIFFHLFHVQKSEDSVDSGTEHMSGTVPSDAILYCNCTYVSVNNRTDQAAMHVTHTKGEPVAKSQSL